MLYLCRSTEEDKVNEKEENLEMDCVGNGVFPGDGVCGDVCLQSDGGTQCGG